jgi:hypothetical protein
MRRLERMCTACCNCSKLQLRKRHTTLFRKWLTRHFITFWNLNRQIGAKDSEIAFDVSRFVRRVSSSLKFQSNRAKLRKIKTLQWCGIAVWFDLKDLTWYHHPRDRYLEHRRSTDFYYSTKTTRNDLRDLYHTTLATHSCWQTLHQF